MDVGIGIVIGKDGTNLTARVIDVAANTPAWNQGIRPGDWILKVGGAFTSMLFPNLSSAIKGPAGTYVELTLHRPGEDCERIVTVRRGIEPAPTTTMAPIASSYYYHPPSRPVSVVPASTSTIEPPTGFLKGGEVLTANANDEIFNNRKVVPSVKRVVFVDENKYQNNSSNIINRIGTAYPIPEPVVLKPELKRDLPNYVADSNMMTTKAHTGAPPSNSNMAPIRFRTVKEVFGDQSTVTANFKGRSVNDPRQKYSTSMSSFPGASLAQSSSSASSSSSSAPYPIMTNKHVPDIASVTGSAKFEVSYLNSLLQRYLQEPPPDQKALLSRPYLSMNAVLPKNTSSDHYASRTEPSGRRQHAEKPYESIAAIYMQQRNREPVSDNTRRIDQIAAPFRSYSPSYSNENSSSSSAYWRHNNNNITPRYHNQGYVRDSRLYNERVPQQQPDRDGSVLQPGVWMKVPASALPDEYKTNSGVVYGLLM